MKAFIETQIPEKFSGVIQIEKENNSFFHKAYGYRDYYNKIENTLETKFPTASAGKAFIAVAILKLIEERKITLSSTLADIFTREFNQIDTSITVKELLTHTSGIPDYFDEDISEDYSQLWKDLPNYSIRKNEDIYPLFIEKPMMFTRGEKFKYNNTGFVILASIIEEITGMAFDVYLSDVIFSVAKMENTGYFELDCLPQNTANAYIFDKEKQRYYSNIYSVDTKGTGAGGCFTTTGDIALFWRVLESGLLISKDSVKEMMRPQTDKTNQYGLGMWLIPKEDDYYIPYFQGSDPGVSFITSYDIRKSLIVTLVSNFEDNVWKIRSKIYPKI